ncbi:ATP-grasp domain-containing protein [Actinomadura sp. NAK00032]|uniref:acetyl-CoA carboxylase family protein n=1 Tax=Actinomadura sp. NAK00032 TaxID=2742128 RepID=UPI001590475D|nr:carboxyl transferase domain-containing protein [Actinomadura sp. NAK00032]QKW36056.1 ATP-grasp domain-containing protein [Actinomadura sp. NAK00032]
MGGILVANRGEIALRVVRAAAELGLRTVAVRTRDDAASAHTRRADEVRALPGEGVAGYLDADALIAAAADAGAAAVHPGYGFLSENAAFAAGCAAAGLTFVGPRPELLELFGDKARARDLARAAGVPVAPGTGGAVDLAGAEAFAREHGPVMLKALAGGGGRGMRVVADPAEMAAAYERCRSEALAAFGSGELYAEKYVPRARHIEVQVAGDGTGAVTHLWERDCSVQRRHQKLIEVAPAPALPAGTRDALLDAALRMAARVRYESLGTFEFLVAGAEFWFLEANPRLQVEHTVTEEITGVDLVKAQIRLALGEDLAGVGLAAPPAASGCAVQVRVNTETIGPDGAPHPRAGTLTAFAPPSGPGVRVDTCGYAGYRTSLRYDPLLAKVIARAEDLPSAAARAHGALGEFEVAGVSTSIPLLQGVLRHPEFTAGRADTSFVGGHLAELLDSEHRRYHPETAAHAAEPEAAAVPDAPPGTVAVPAPMQGTVVSVEAAEGDLVRAGAPVVILEAMKMEHVVRAGEAGVVRMLAAAPGDTVAEGAPLLFTEPADAGGDHAAEEDEADLDAIRADLAETLRRHAIGLDAARPEAVAKRHARGHRTARENIADLCDPGTFVEYGALAIAAQRQRRSLDELIERTPADGMVCGIGDVDGAQAVVMSYDYTVLAGTQGHQNHRKTDRMLDIAHRRRLPLVLFAEGGGGRPGDTDTSTVSGLDVTTFHAMGRLSGVVPSVGIASGRCFAGNAALLGCCDAIIATRDANIGMGGPAMIEGGGLGVFAPEEIGPIADQEPNGVVDIVVDDEAAAVDAARRYLSYFQGPREEWECGDQRALRHLVPENRMRAYDVRCAAGHLADTGSLLELRRAFGVGIITALVRIEGRPMGLIASNPAHLGGAIDRDAADKAARFLQLCDAHGLPVVSLCDTPGFMVGPDAERTATVRHFGRLFVIGANLRVPVITIVLRKGYGLGAQAMAGGGFKAPLATVAWPTGEIGGMGLEGAVRLGFRKELEAAEDPEALFEQMVAAAYEYGKALHAATVFELDDVIDPADTRRWITAVLAGAPPVPDRPRPWIDTW